MPVSTRASQARSLSLLSSTFVRLGIGATLALLLSCSHQDASNDAGPQANSPATKTGAVMELTISGLGGGDAQTEVQWVSPSTSTKTTANPVPLPGFLDVASVSTSTVDVAGFRYISATLKVRNAPQCGTPGSCAPYVTARQNVTFMAVMQAATINQTAVSRFKRFDGSDANFALTTQLLPGHGLSNSTFQVAEPLASLQVYDESELPPAEPTVLSVFPYGFVVRNVNDNSRTLPANPANGQYDGIVTFGFRIPVQTLATDDPFKISLRFQTVDDLNLRFTQSTQEQTSAGDIAAERRAASLNAQDLVVLGGRVAQTSIGNPICSVRIAGFAGAATAFLVNSISFFPQLAAAPINLSFVNRTSAVSLGYCENMLTPVASNFIVSGSQSGKRVVGGAYGGVFTGGAATNRPNQIVFDITGQKPFFPGETVSFSGTSFLQAANFNNVLPFASSFRIKGSTPGVGNFGAATTYAAGNNPLSMTLGDLNGDGNLDLVTANNGSSSISFMYGNGLGGFSGPTSVAVGTNPQYPVLGDVNGDGILDIVVANFSSNSVSVLIGTGTGFFVINTITVGAGPNSVALGDITNDGHLDLVVTNSLSNTISLMSGIGSGFFNPATNYSASVSGGSAKLADLNHDGRLDLVTADYAANNITVHLNNSLNGFLPATVIAAGATPSSVELADMNLDGRLDAVVTNANSNSVSIMLGNGAGGFAAPTSFPVGSNPYSVSVGDLNGDGKLDLVVPSVNTPNYFVLLGNGSGGITTSNSYLAALSQYSAALGDLNGDGKLDLVASQFAVSNNVRVSLGQ